MTPKFLALALLGETLATAFGILAAATILKVVGWL